MQLWRLHICKVALQSQKLKKHVIGHEIRNVFAVHFELRPFPLGVSAAADGCLSTSSGRGSEAHATSKEVIPHPGHYIHEDRADEVAEAPDAASCYACLPKLCWESCN